MITASMSWPVFQWLSVTTFGYHAHNTIIEQIFVSALLVEGIYPDPSSMALRVQQIIEAALRKG